MRRVFELQCALVLGLGLGLAGCTLDRGQGFATLERANLEISLEAESDSGESEILTDRGYEIVVEHAALHVSRLELQELVSQPVDDAGHDHEHDESDHEHDEHAALDEAFSALITLGFDAPISMTAHEAVPADRYEPSREFARSSPERVLVVLSHLELEGMVSGGDFGDDSVDLVVDLALDTELAASFEPFEIDQHGPESVRLSTAVAVAGTLFDGVDLAALVERGSVVIDDPDTAAAVVLSTALAASETRASLE